MIVKIDEKKYKKSISDKILNALPEWFGLPESTSEYIEKSMDMPFWAWIEEKNAQGFVSLKETSPYTVEVYVMGVLKSSHRKGIGKALFQAAMDYAREKGYSFMQVKTVKEGCYKEYDITNRFYKSMGFKEFECFPNLWDEWNPCQVMVMNI